jgi:hypothetical protein
MEFITNILNCLGLGLSESAPDIVKFSLFFLILLCFVLLNVINICIYLLSIYIISNDKILNLIPVKYVYIHKILRYYKNIRITLIIYEVLLLLIALFIMISINYGIVSYYIHIK